MKKYLLMIWNILKYVLIYFLFQGVTGVVAAVYYRLKYQGILSTVEIQEKLIVNIYPITALAGVFSLLIFIILLKNKDENLWQRCRFDKISSKSIFLILLVAIGISVVSNGIVQLTYDMFPSYENVSNSISEVFDTFSNNEEVSRSISDYISSILGILSITVLMPAFEEIFFRGLIFNELRKNTNIVVSIILQALIFAAFHGNMLQGIYTFILGVILALIYIWTKSIWSIIFLHIFYNILGTMVVPYLIQGLNYTIVYMSVGMIILVSSIVSIYKEHLRTNVPSEIEA